MKVTVNYIGPHAASVSFTEDATLDGEPAEAIVVSVNVREKPASGPRAPGAWPPTKYDVDVVRRQSRGAEAGDGPHSSELVRRSVKL